MTVHKRALTLKSGSEVVVQAYPISQELQGRARIQWKDYISQLTLERLWNFPKGSDGSDRERKLLRLLAPCDSTLKIDGWMEVRLDRSSPAFFISVLVSALCVSIPSKDW